MNDIKEYTEKMFEDINIQMMMKMNIGWLEN